MGREAARGLSGVGSVYVSGVQQVGNALNASDMLSGLFKLDVSASPGEELSDFFASGLLRHAAGDGTITEIYYQQVLRPSNFNRDGGS